MAFEYPLSEPGLILVQGKEPMLCFTEDRGIPAQYGFRFDEICGIKRTSAFFALVAVRLIKAANRTCSRDIPVGKEMAGCLIIILQ